MIDVKARINQRRRQMIIHSYIYYRLGTSIIDDKTFDRWAYELRDLQRQYPTEASECVYAAAFANWDGTTGFDLPIGDVWVQQKATQLLRYHERRETS